VDLVDAIYQATWTASRNLPEQRLVADAENVRAVARQGGLLEPQRFAGADPETLRRASTTDAVHVDLGEGTDTLMLLLR
jgi:hypothetical protein